MGSASLLSLNPAPPIGPSELSLQHGRFFLYLCDVWKLQSDSNPLVNFFLWKKKIFHSLICWGHCWGQRSACESSSLPLPFRLRGRAQGLRPHGKYFLFCFVLFEGEKVFVF